MTATANISDLYAEALALYKYYLSPSFDIQCRERTHSLAEALISFYQNEPQALIAQLFISKPQYPYIVNYSLNSAIITLAMGSQASICEQLQRQLVCAALSANISWLKQLNSLAKSAPDKTVLTARMRNPLLSAKQLQRQGVKDQVWLDAVIHQKELTDGSGKPQHLSELQLPVESQIVAFSQFIADYITPRAESKLLPLFKLLKLALTVRHNKFSANCSELLIKALGLIPSGSLVKYQQSCYAVVLYRQQQTLVLQPLEIKSLTPIGEFTLLPSEQVEMTYPAYNCKNESYWRQFNSPQLRSFVRKHLNNIEQKQSDDTFKLANPPQALESLQQALNQPSPDINKVCAAIESDQQLSTELINAAAKLTKNELKVTSARHALMLMGFVSAGHKLVYAALQSQLFQEQYPFKNQLREFSRIRCHFAYHLADLCNLLHPGQIASFTLFSMAGVGCLPQIKNQRLTTKVMLSNKELYRSGAFLPKIELSQADNLSLKIAQGWQQPPLLRKAIQASAKFPNEITESIELRQLIAILGLSNLLTISVFYPLNWQQEDVGFYSQQACRVLKVSYNQIKHIVQTIVNETQPFSPLIP